ncbi:MAG: glycoside hydrolase family 18 protein [Bacteroidia bacterium]|nr:glycoside hydrolase family 18 protein [Bacteroidia bacterium]
MKILSPFHKLFLPLLVGLSFVACQPAEEKTATPPATTGPKVIAYYSGQPINGEDYQIHALDQIIHSFCHLKGNKLAVDNAEDTTAIEKLVALKTTYPSLKILLSLGGWGGCETCSDVFSSDAGRKEFAESVKELSLHFNTDGLDLDWEYPAISGYPNHVYKPEDKHNFTLLVKELRETMGENFIISFAAGGFEKFLVESVEWDQVMPLVDNVNLMTYDLINGNSPSTGHHTALFPNDRQIESTDHAVKFLDSLGVPKSKMVIGAAFYARVWEKVSPENRGLYQPGTFKQSVRYNNLESFFQENAGFVTYWDSITHAPYAWNAEKQMFATFDDIRSIAEKTRYAADNQLGGIMFWQLSGDKNQGGLLETIHLTKSGN